MTSTTTLSRRLHSLAKLVERTVADASPQIASRRVEFAPCIAEQLREDGKNFVFALRDAIGVLTPEGGAE